MKWDEAGEFVFASGNGRIHAFETRDPTASALAGASVPLGAACHMSALGTVDGTEYSFCTGDALTKSVYRVVAPTPDTRTLVPVTVNLPPRAPHSSLPQTGFLGYYLLDEPPVAEGAIVPNVWDVNLVRGLVDVTDISTGLRVLHYAPDAIGDEMLTGFS